VQPAAPRLPRLVPALTLVVSMLVVVLVPAALWTVATGGGSDRCPGIAPSTTGDEWVGLGDGTADCTFFPEPRGDLERDQQAVERRIAAENRSVLAAADDGEPYTTLVFFAPLTVPPDEPEREGQTSLRQLRGVALAQAEINDQARRDRGTVQVRVLLANPGDRFAFGPRVARQITAESRRDETLVGVVGIAQSRASSREAIAIVAEENLPVVAGPVTGDRMVESSSYYYQVSPRNERVARMLVAFATTGVDDRRPARQAVIVTDHSDEYSQNLADDIHASFDRAGGETIRMFSYPVEDPSLPLPAPDPANLELRVPSLDQLASDVCTSLGEAPDAAVFFTSRAQQLAGMLDNMRNAPSCTGRTVTVVGGTDITKFVQNPDVDLTRYPFVRLYYGAFASPALLENNVAQQFVADYRAAFPDADIAVDMSDPALTYDAVFAMQEAANETWTAQLPITADTVAAKLHDGEVDIEGATGYLHFDGELERHRVPADKPVLVLEATADPSAEPLLVCGRLAESVERTTWGPGGRFPCLTDEP
jgi:ABC-type branched-subunit amino acid transport system substrate-binding protein